uniref:Uncharacterized protein n=1 Tax=Coturnix japonica TaxID=93934 RepID=A0A8C2YCL2_COTJA
FFNNPRGLHLMAKCKFPISQLAPVAAHPVARWLWWGCLRCSGTSDRSCSLEFSGWLANAKSKDSQEASTIYCSHSHRNSFIPNVLQMSFSLFPSTTVGTLFLFIKISTFEASQR